jgi:hypothetical protein
VPRQIQRINTFSSESIQSAGSATQEEAPRLVEVVHVAAESEHVAETGDNAAIGETKHSQADWHQAHTHTRYTMGHGIFLLSDANQCSERKQ